MIAVGSGSPRDSIDIKFSGSIISIEPPALEVDDIIELCINVSIGFDLVVIKFVGVILPKKCCEGVVVALGVVEIISVSKSYAADVVEL